MHPLLIGLTQAELQMGGCVKMVVRAWLLAFWLLTPGDWRGRRAHGRGGAVGRY